MVSLSKIWIVATGVVGLLAMTSGARATDATEGGWELGLIAGGASTHFNTRVLERSGGPCVTYTSGMAPTTICPKPTKIREQDELNENQRTLGVEAIHSSGALLAAAYYRDSFDGDAGYVGAGKLWTRDILLFGASSTALSVSGGGMALVSYRRMLAWWRVPEAQHDAAMQKSLVVWPAPVGRVSVGPLSVSAMVVPKIDLGKGLRNDYTVVYTQFSVRFK